MAESHYLFVSNEDSKLTHPGNTPDDFTVELPRPLNLDGHWVCGLKEIYVSNKVNTGKVYVCTDLCQESLVCDTYTPVLRVIHKAVATRDTALTFDDPYYVKVQRERLQRLRIFTRGDKLSTIKFKSNGHCSCTIHLKRI